MGSIASFVTLMERYSITRTLLYLNNSFVYSLRVDRKSSFLTLPQLALCTEETASLGTDVDIAMCLRLERKKGDRMMKLLVVLSAIYCSDIT